MGVTYKLRDEVVQFIINQRQGDPLSSCRQLAESASQKFGLHLSKSSVHDVLKESGIVTPRGRKPKNKFEIPQEKKKQIQTSLSQVKLLASPVDHPPEEWESKALPLPAVLNDQAEVLKTIEEIPVLPQKEVKKEVTEISPEHEGAGRIFFKAALWDLGIFSDPVILKEEDWKYFLTYSKGVKVFLENSKDFFIDLPVPIERCIRVVADGLINKSIPFIVQKVSDEELFKACMEAQTGFKMSKILIVDEKDHILFEFSNIVDYKIQITANKAHFMESYEKDVLKRAQKLFFSQNADNKELIERTFALKGFESAGKDENIVTIMIESSYECKDMINNAAEKLNGMALRDEENRLVTVKIQEVAR